VLDAAKGVALLATDGGGALEAARGRPPDRPGLPVVAVPTTAGTGAETNGFAVLEHPRERRKVYLGDDSVRPRHAVLDPELLLGLPPAATAATGLDALVHGIESLASLGSDETSAGWAEQAVALVAGSLAAAVQDGSDLGPRADLMLGAHLAGRALSRSGLGLVHGIAHAVTAYTGAVHGLALGAVLGEVMARSLDAATPAYARVAAAMGVAPAAGDDRDAATAALDAVTALTDEVRTRPRLRDLGLPEASVEGVADAALADPVSRNHPRPFPPAEVQDVLRCRW
jgi:alcohol dehydrogenase class IV